VYLQVTFIVRVRLFIAILLVLAALFKTTTSNDLTEAANFIIYDSGSGGTSAALLKIDPKKSIDGVTAKSMEIIGLESDSGLGGDLIDERIASLLISKFESINAGVKVTSGKPRNKVLIEAARIKKILNANDKAMASLEDLVEDYGMNSSISRDDIDALLSDLAPRFIAPIEKLLSKSNLNLDKVSAILLIGGNSRHQFLLKSLKSAFGSEKLSVTLDPDESIVKGATLYSAKLHPAFRLRPTHFMDITPSGLYVQYRELKDEATTSDGDMKKVELFPETSPLQTRKSLTLKKMNNVFVELFYSRDNRKIASISVNGFKEAVEKSSVDGKQRHISSKMKIPVLLSSSGHVVLEDPVAVIEYEETISKKVYKTHTKTPTPTPTTPQSTSEPTPNPSETPGTTATTTEKVNPVETSVETQIVEEKVKRTKNIKLPHELVFEMPPMTLDEIKKCQSVIEAAREKEFEKNRVANARNDLEKAVYRIQGELTSVDFTTYASNSERSSVKSQLSKISKFLAEEPNEKVTAETYLNHFDELVKIESLVKFRQKEELERPDAIEKLQQALASANEFVQTQRAIEKDLRPQSDEDLASLAKKIQEDTKWLQDRMKKQASMAKNADPVVLISDLDLKFEDVSKLVSVLKSKKMPAKPVEKTPVQEEAPIETANVTATTENVTETATLTETISPIPTQTPTTTQISGEDLVEERFEL
jgi:molecular chaperone DnaK (HSP70)